MSAEGGGARPAIPGRAGEKGAALILTLVALTLVMALGYAAFNLSTGELRAARQYRDLMAALDQAEAGLEHALAVLRGNPAAREPLNGGAGDVGTYVVTMETAGPGEVLVRSTGRSGGSSRSITARVRTGSSEGYRRALFSTGGGTLKLEGRVTIYGDVHVNGDVQVEGEAQVRAVPEAGLDGDLSLAGTLRYRGSGARLEVDGEVTERAPPLPVDEKEAEWYRERADRVYREKQSFTGNFSLDDELVFVDEKVEISGVFRGRGTIVATGKIVINDGSNPRGLTYAPGTDSLLTLVSLEKIEVEADTVEALLHSYGKVDFKVSATVRGAVVGHTMHYEDELVVRYDPRLQGDPTPGLPGDEVELVEWRE